MKSKRLIALAFGTCLFFAGSPCFVLAQTPIGTTGTTSGTTGTTGSSSTSSSQGGVGTTSTSSSSTTSTTSPGIVQTQVQSRTSGTGSATTNPSNSNPFVATYGDYMSLGQPSKYANSFGPLAKPTVTFGKGIYTTTATTTTNTPTTTTQANGFTTTGIVRNPQYTTVLSEELPPVIHKSDAILADVRSVIDRSTFVTNKNAIQVNVTGNIIELRGAVGTEKERRMVEGMVRMSPGVYDVQNKLTIVQSK
jgi:hypothetical protein